VLLIESGGVVQASIHGRTKMNEFLRGCSSE